MGGLQAHAVGRVPPPWRTRQANQIPLLSMVPAPTFSFLCPKYGNSVSILSIRSDLL
jgi:hypothetical protein